MSQSIYKMILKRTITNTYASLEIVNEELFNGISNDEKEPIKAYIESYGDAIDPKETVIYAVTLNRTESGMDIKNEVLNEELLKSLPEEEQQSVAVTKDILEEGVTIDGDMVLKK